MTLAADLQLARACRLFAAVAADFCMTLDLPTDQGDATMTTAETITDEQIRALSAESHAESIMRTVCIVALDDADDTTTSAARARMTADGTDKHAGPWTKGWHLDGAGPARYGWARNRAAGGVEFVGYDLVSIARAECARVLAYFESHPQFDAEAQS